MDPKPNRIFEKGGLIWVHCGCEEMQLGPLKGERFRGPEVTLTLPTVP